LSCELHRLSNTLRAVTLNGDERREFRTGRNAKAASSGILGEVHSVEHLLDDGGTLTSAQRRLLVQIDQQTFIHVICRKPRLAADDRRRNGMVECILHEGEEFARRRGRRRHWFVEAFVEDLVDHFGAWSDFIIPGTHYLSVCDLKQKVIVTGEYTVQIAAVVATILQQLKGCKIVAILTIMATAALRAGCMHASEIANYL